MSEAKFYPDMSIDEYHGHAKDMVLSKTMLKEILPPSGCPALFKWLYLDGGVDEKESTQSLNMGKAVHTLALEPELFEQTYFVLPEKYEDGKKVVRNESHKKYQELLEQAGDKEIIREQDMENIKSMAKALTLNPFALSLLNAPGHIESSIFWTDEETGLKLRCRPDFMRDDGLIVDLKMAQTARPDLFRKHAFDFAYDVSVALTCRGYEALYGKRPDNYVLLLVEPKKPHLIEAYDTFRSYEMELSYLDGGELRLQQAMHLIQMGMETNNWPSYVGEIRPMEYPVYAKKFLEVEEE